MSKEKCTEDFIANAVKLMNSGAQGKDIAMALGVRASTLSTWLNHPKTDNQKKLSEAMKKAEVNRTTAMVNAVMKAGMTKDWKAAAWWLERNKPMEYSLSNARMQRLIEQHEAENPRPVLDTAQLVPPAYWDVWRDIMQGGHSTYEARGGRGGLKTSMFTLAAVMLMLNDPKMCGVGFRQVSATIRDSIMAAFISSIRRLGVEHDFTWTFNPMEITRKSTGQVVMFRGLDDPEKTKSLQLRDPDMYIGFAVWEEFNQFKGMAPVRKAEQTVKRGAAPLFRTFRMWNTHPDCEHWSNAHFEESMEDPDTYALQVNYDQVPPEWLGEGFLKDAARLKAASPEAYDNEYMGKTTKLTGRVFGNVEDRELAPGEERGFKWVRNGIDWGFMQDPFVFLRVAYDRKADELFIFDEIYNTEVLDAPNIAEVRRRLAERDAQGNIRLDSDGDPVMLRSKPENEIRADAAAPKDIATWASEGMRILGASKRIPVADGIQWLRKRRRISIDRKRCPLAWAEFTRYRAMEDEEGRFQGFPDKDNHAVDAVRYAAFDLINDPSL